MHKVKNKKIIKILSTRSLRANRKKNLIAVLAIMLTCILFTAVFSIGGSMLKSSQESTMRQVGSSQMAGLKYALPEDYETLSKDAAVKHISKKITVGHACNEELSKVNTEINYADEIYAKSSFNEPQQGHMPKERNEIAASSIVLKALGIPCKVGEKVPLMIDVDGKIIEEEFTLAGWWEGDKVAMAQEVWVSREFADEAAPTPETPFNGKSYAGYWDIGFDFATSFDIKGQVMEVLERNGYDVEQAAYAVNWAYMGSEIDAQSVILMAGLLLIILISGYLIIYNVFYINVIGEIHEYGLLKTIGTTAIQLRGIVRRQAVLLSLIGIPAGLFVGTVLSKVLFPIVIKEFTFYHTSFSMHPLIYIAAALFSFLTVLLSCNKPCRLAARVSPIEAIRYTEKTSDNRKAKKSRRVSVLTMAAWNIRRSKKKVIVVVLSLSMSLILVNVVYSIVHSFDLEKYISNSIVGDINITHSSIINIGSNVRIEDGISKAEQELFSQLDGVASGFPVYKSMGNISLDEAGMEKVYDYVERHESLQNDSWIQEELDGLEERKELFADIYALNEGGFSKLGLWDDAVDWETFQSGEYVILAAAEDQDAIFESGDKIRLCLPDGLEKEYTILAFAELPYPMSTRSFPVLGERLILPEKEYLAHSGDGAMMMVFEVEDGKQSTVEEWMKRYTETGNSELVCVSKQTYVKEFQSLVSMFWIVGGALSLILALIGSLNFVNVIVTGMLTRKQEFAMMEAVGMTRKQLRSMLIFEGMLYAAFTLFFSLTIGSVISSVLVKGVAGTIWFFRYHFSVLPIMLCAPLLILFSVLIPYVAYVHVSRESIVERLKMIE